MGFLTDIGEFLLSIGGLLVNFIGTFKDAIIHGLKFFFEFFLIIPNFLMSTFFPNLPEFFSVTLYGLLGFMLFVVVAKVYFSLKG